MRLRTNSALPLSAVLFGLLLVPGAARAVVNNCPTEPAQNVAIADGAIFTGANCNLYTVGDVDSFTFNATSGDIYLFFAALNGGSQTICLALIDPHSVQVFSGCSYTYPYGAAVGGYPQTLTVTGVYTMVVTETSTGTQNHAVSLQRIYPIPSNAQPIAKLGQVFTGEVTPLTAQDPFTFNAATTGVYRATAALTSGNTQNLCMSVYNPDGSINISGCSNTYPYGTVVTLDFPPNKNGTMLVLIGEDGDDGTVGYTLDVSCYSGKCPTLPPSCSLTDTLSYASGTLTMNFTVENSYATTWNIWLIDQNTMQLLYQKPQPITDTPTPITQTTALSPEGKVGILSTLTAPTAGITCSSWVQFQTGKP